jgi:thioredoxin 1
MATVKIGDADFEQQVTKNDKAVLVDFWAEWCQPCRVMEPALEEISNELSDKLVVAKLNVDENPETAQQFQVMSIPTMILFKEGQAVDQLVGAMPKEAVVNKLMPHLA